MNTSARLCAAIFGTAVAAAAHAGAAHADPRLREIQYDAHAVVTVPVKRGVVTLVVFAADEAITDVASGLGSDCTKADAVWCVAAQAGGHHLFVKPKSAASAPNNLAVITDKRTYSFRFLVLPDGDKTVPLYRLTIKAPLARQVVEALSSPSSAPPAPPSVPDTSPPDAVGERLQAAPQLVNSSYSIAEGRGSDEIVPTLIFDDGRFTYLQFPGNRGIPAVFDVLSDGSETLVNTRMEGDLLVVDRTSRRLMLRSGAAVVGVWNEAFDLDGIPPEGGTTVHGVQRTIKGAGVSELGQHLPEGKPHE